VLGTQYEPVGTRFYLILGTRLSILRTRIGSLNTFKKHELVQGFPAWGTFAYPKGYI